jgi:site-specific recombinase XerD
MELLPKDSALLRRFEQHLIDSRYTRSVIAHHVDRAEKLLSYLHQVGLAAETVTCEDLSRYLSALIQRYRRDHLRSPRSMINWHCWQTTGVHSFLRFVQGRWPPPPVPGNAHEQAIDALLTEYRRCERERRALAPATMYGQVHEALRFLHWLPEREISGCLAKLTITDIDRYMKWRATGYARPTVKLACVNMRRFLRFLQVSGWVKRDLAAGLMGPTLYRFEGIPSVIRPEQTRAILDDARKDHSEQGLRNYAMLLLLVTYGLRAGEICRLQLGDVDWRDQRLWIRHSKTGRRSCLPLTPSVGQAILDYVRRGRPRCKDREIFIRMRGPRGAFASNTALYSMLRRQLARLGIRLSGKRGSHVFRHARAAALLRAGVPVKTIGDLLGHRSASSTAVYLKLDHRELRNVALSIPLPEVTP